MKSKSLFPLMITLAAVSPLVNISSAEAQCPPGSRNRPCRPVVTKSGAVRGGGTMPSDLLQRVNVLMDQGNPTEATKLLTQFLEQAVKTQNIPAQADAHQALADVDTRMGKLDSASSHLKSAGALYQQVGNVQRFGEIQGELQQIQIQRIPQIQRIQPQ